MRFYLRGITYPIGLLLTVVTCSSLALAQGNEGGNANGVVSAATFVAAVLEHHGYLTQAEFLQQFKSFFRDAGAFVYLMAGIGAVLSVAMYGSFRAARYLLLGPALFWFLVGPTTTTGGVLWKVGGGEPLGMFRQKGEGAARESRDEVIERMGSEIQQEIEVATGFWLFAYPINEFVNEFVDIMLDEENSWDLTTSYLVTGLELMAVTQPTNNDYIKRVNSFMADCVKTMAHSQAIAELIIQDPQTARNQPINLNSRQAKQLKEYAQTEHIEKLRESGFAHYIKYHATEEGGTSELAKSIYEEAGNKVPQKITCEKAWSLVAEETWTQAKKDEPNILAVASGQWEYDEAEGEVCKRLTAKVMDDGEEGDCNLTPAIALSNLYNYMTSLKTYSDVLTRIWNDKTNTNLASGRVLTGPLAHGWKPVMGGQNGDKTVSLQTHDQFGRPTMMMLVEKPHPDHQGDSEKNMRAWAPVSTLVAIDGMDHAMWVATRRYEVSKLRQEMFTFAMNLPYYQGVVLYLIAISYPFMALIVILPGKAINFMNLPLFWLWVKSWDIGWAAVITLDKVLFDSLPPWNIRESLREDWSEIERLPEMLAEGFIFDPLGHLHIYYATLSIVTMTIPAITGAATVRVRRSVIASFTDAANAAARDRADAAGDAHSVVAQNKRNALMMQIRGQAKLATVMGTKGPDSGFTGRSSDLWGMIAGASHISNNPLDFLGAKAKYHQARSKMVEAEANYQGALVQAFHPLLGRYGILQMQQEAYASAMAGPGGFELSNNTTDVGEAFSTVFHAKITGARDARQAFIKHSTKNLTDATASGVQSVLEGSSGSGFQAFKDLFTFAAREGLVAAGTGDNSDPRSWVERGHLYSASEFGAATLTDGGPGTLDALFRLAPGAAGGPSSLIRRDLGIVGEDRVLASEQDLGPLYQHPSDPNRLYALAGPRKEGALNKPTRILSNYLNIYGNERLERLEEARLGEVRLREEDPEAYDKFLQERRRALRDRYLGLIGNGIDLRGRYITPDSIERMSDAELAQVGIELANETFDRKRGEVIRATGTLGTEGFETRMWNFEHEARNLGADTQFLMQQSPGYAMTILEEAAGYIGGTSYSSTSIGPNDGPAVFSPSDFYGPSKGGKK